MSARAFCLVVGLAACSASPPPGPGSVQLDRQMLTAQSADLDLVVHHATGPLGDPLRVVHATQAGGGRIEIAAATTPVPLDQIDLGLTATEKNFAAINGGFYAQDQPMGLVIAAGKVLHATTPTGGSGIFSVSPSGARVTHRDAPLPASPSAAVQSIDRLVDGGKSLVSSSASSARDARSAIGVDKRGRVHVVAVFATAAIERERMEGDDQYSAWLNKKSTDTGVTLSEFADLLIALGMTEALNLDGGYSTSLQARVGDARASIVAHRATINAIVLVGAP